MKTEYERGFIAGIAHEKETQLNLRKGAIMSQDQKYNGWQNYATWRVNLEMFDGGDWQGCDADMLKQSAEEWIYETSSEGLARDYALAFLSDVNWHEIAAHYNEGE